jgi:type I restriction enzyme S subunit
MGLMASDQQSGVGQIPADWSVTVIGEIAEVTTGSKNTQDKVPDGEFPFFVRSQTVERINSYSFDGEAVLTAGDGVGTGKVFHYINGKFDLHQRVYRISNFQAAIDGYFFYLYFSSHFYDRIMSMTAKSSVDSVRMEMITKMAIPLPPSITEQRAIATALSDVDALIAGLERLIAKKRDIKQAAMQQLLTGQTRLPGFSGEWERKLLGAACTITTGKKDVNEGDPNGQFPFFTCSRTHTFSQEYSFDTEAILIAGNGEVGNLHFFSGKFEAYQRTYVGGFKSEVQHLQPCKVRRCKAPQDTTSNFSLKSA